MPERVVEVRDVHKHFTLGRNQVVKSVDGVSFSIQKGETLGLVGESGSGKSTLGRTIVDLYKATSGHVLFEGKEVQGLSRSEKYERTRKMQMIFQDPQASLNPRMRVGDIVAEGMDAFGLAKGKERRKRIFSLLE